MYSYVCSISSYVCVYIFVYCYCMFICTQQVVAVAAQGVPGSPAEGLAVLLHTNNDKR